MKVGCDTTISIDMAAGTMMKAKAILQTSLLISISSYADRSDVRYAFLIPIIFVFLRIKELRK